MKGDFTRDTFNPGKHFLRVLMQQGRVQVDADWNEQVAILLHYMQTLAADLIGRHGGPAADCGFSILDGHDRNFGIGKGRYYVDGILCENQATPVSIIPPTPISTTTAGQTEITVSSLNPDGLPFKEGEYVEVLTLDQLEKSKPGKLAKIHTVNTQHAGKPSLVLDTKDVLSEAMAVRRADTYQTQPDFPYQPDQHALRDGNYLVYLDVWERHISHLEDEAIREVALGGPDTATRSQVVWQVKAQQLRQASNCDDGMGELNLIPLSTALLKAQTAEPEHPATEEPCVLPPEARYRGMENRLYRVEIHTGSFDETGKENTEHTFKWSRDDGSVSLAVKDVKSDTTEKTTKVELASLGSGCEISLAVGDWVEIVDDKSVLMNEAKPLLKVIAIDQIGRTVTLEVMREDIDIDKSKHPLLRRWDFKTVKQKNVPIQADDDKALLIQEGTWLTLEDGVQIWFETGTTDSPRIYRTGDYWLIPARVETGDIEWPEQMDASGKPLVDQASKSAAKALSPRGVLHHYAPLAILSVDNSGNTTVLQPDDCRCKFDPLSCKTA